MGMVATVPFELDMATVIELYDARKESEAAMERYLEKMHETLSRLISAMARNWSQKGSSNVLAAKEDLYQDAIVVMMESIHEYDPHISKPSTFFMQRFESVMKKAVNRFPVPVTEYYADNAVVADLTLKKSGFKGLEDPRVTIDLLVDLCNWSVKTARAVLELSRRQYCTLEDPDRATLVDSHKTPEQAVLNEESVKALMEACERLTPLERYVITRVKLDKVSYRTLVTQFKTDTNACEAFSLDRKQITGKFLKQIESKALRKLYERAGYKINPEMAHNDIYVQATPDDIMGADVIFLD